jgi:hypothetical protein
MASRVFVFDKAINSRSAFIDHKPIRRIVLAMMLPSAGIQRRRRCAGKRAYGRYLRTCIDNRSALLAAGAKRSMNSVVLLS